MITVDLPVPVRVLAIGAHPDDIEFGCGATLAKWAAAGAAVHLCVCTDGAKGTWDPQADLRALVATREEEQRDAAEVLGATDVHFLRCVDGELDHGLPTRAAVAAVIRAVRPAVVLGHDPWRPYRMHADHRHAGLVAIEGVVAARDPHFFPELAAPPHRPDTLLLFEPARVDHVEDVTGYVERKIDALLRHRSQWRSTMGIHDQPERQRAAFAERQRDQAQAAGIYAGVRSGEAFARM
ncbi:MAG: PIG-L deacetylase family protein [Actinomycetota bacterium]